MAHGVATLVSEELRAAEGVWSAARMSPPVAAADIRRWAIATYWPTTPPRLFWDEEYARSTHWGGIVAPRDFNPFAWPVERPERPGGRATGPDGLRLTSMNGGQVDTYGVPIRPDDQISARSRLRNWNEREGRFGLTLYLFNETEWHNQRGEFVRRRVSTSIRY